MDFVASRVHPSEAWAGLYAYFDNFKLTYHSCLSVMTMFCDHKSQETFNALEQTSLWPEVSQVSWGCTIDGFDPVSSVAPAGCLQESNSGK